MLQKVKIMLLIMISFLFLLFQPVLTSYYLDFTTSLSVQKVKLETGFDWLWLMVLHMTIDTNEKVEEFSTEQEIEQEPQELMKMDIEEDKAKNIESNISETTERKEKEGNKPQWVQMAISGS